MTMIPDWKLERYLLGELDDTDMRQVREAADRDPSVRERLQMLEQSNREIQSKYPPAWMGDRIRDKLEDADTRRTRGAKAPARRAWGIRRAVLVPAAVLAAVAFAVFVLPDLVPTHEHTRTEVTRIKGPGVQLGLFRKTTDGSERLEDGDVAAEGDQILLQYGVDEPEYGAIVSVDGRGIIMTHLPAQGGEAMALAPGQHLLDYSYELDDAPRWEVFFFVTSESTFPVEAVRNALASSAIVQEPRAVEHIDDDFLRSLHLPDGCRVTTFTLKKGEVRHEN